MSEKEQRIQLTLKSFLTKLQKNMKNTQTLEEKVAAFKLIARNSLRMNLVSGRLSKVGRLEEELAILAKRKESLDHEVKVENYEISVLDANHPNYDKRKTAKEENVKEYTDSLTDLAKEVEAVEKRITEQKEAIAKIESGETKVCLEDLNDLVASMVRQDALNQVSAE